MIEGRLSPDYDRVKPPTFHYLKEMEGKNINTRSISQSFRENFEQQGIESERK